MAADNTPDLVRPDRAAERLLVAMEPGRDRELLGDWLAGLDGYEVTIVDGDDRLPEEYDLCLLDPSLLEALRPALESRRAAADPVYLPHVLLAPAGNAGGNDRRERAVATDPALDDYLSLPMEKPLLRQRLENLLETRRASRRLAEREEQYRGIVALMPEAIMLLDGDEIAYANRAAGRMFVTGASDALIGRAVDSLATGGDWTALRSLLEEIEAGETAADADAPGAFVELTLRSASGEPIEAAVAGVRVTFDGAPATQLVIRDLTARKRRERQLDLFGRAIEAATQGITIADARQDDEPLIYANDGFERITGYPVGEVLGRNCRFLQGPNTATEPVTRLREAIAAGAPASVDLLNYRRDGTPFWNRVDVVPITDDAGAVTHYLGFQRDITARKRREQRLSVLNRVLRHNLRNKLTVIRGYAEEIDYRSDPPPDAARRIREAADELLGIADRVREFDTVITAEGGGTERLDLVAVVDRAVAGLREQSPDADVTVTTAAGATVDGHPALEVVLSDLLAGFGDTGPPRCDVAVRQEGGSVVVDVTDRGDVLDRSDLKVLGRDIETPLEHLQGLELWLLRWTVEQSNGEVRVDADRDAPRIQLRFPTADGEAGTWNGGG